MTIRNRLTWLFWGWWRCCCCWRLAVVLILQAGYTEREFRQRLRDRAQVTGYIYLEKDEMRASAFRDFEKKYLQSLTNEILQVYDASGEVRFVAEDERVHLPESILARIVANEEYLFHAGPAAGSGHFLPRQPGRLHHCGGGRKRGRPPAPAVPGHHYGR